MSVERAGAEAYIGIYAAMGPPFGRCVRGRPPLSVAYVLYNSSMSERRISEARESFSTTVNRVAFGGERVVLTRHGKRVAAVVPIGDLDLLEQLEDAADLDDVREALADPANQDRIGWSDLKAQLGL